MEALYAGAGACTMRSEIAIKVLLSVRKSQGQVPCHPLEKTSSPKRCYGQMTAAWSRTLPHVASRASMHKGQHEAAR